MATTLESVPCEAFLIRTDGDWITVFLQDFGPGVGRLTVECYGAAWSQYWPAMGDRTVREFVAQAGVDYLAGKLLAIGDRKVERRERARVERIVTIVREALSSPATGA